MPPSSAIDSLAAVARVLALAPRAGEDGLCSALAEEGAALLGARAAALVTLPAAEGADVDVAIAGAPPRRGAAARFAEVAAFATGRGTHRIVRNAEVAASGYEHVLLVALGGDRPARVLSFADVGEEAVPLALAYAAAASGALTHQAEALAHRRAADRQAALTRAAKTLNGTLEFGKLLGRICEEAMTVMEADSAIVYRLTDEGALTIEAAYGLPPEHLRYTMPAGEGLAGKVLLEDRPMMTEDYGRVGKPSAGSPWNGVQASMAVPVHLGGRLRGVLSVAYWRRARLTGDDLETLATFAELAAVAYGKRAARRGEVLTPGELPATFLPGRAAARDRRVRLTPPSAVIEWQPRTDEGAAERLRTRTRQLALANQLGARLAAMTDVDAIARAVVDELHEAFGFFVCAVVRIRDDGQVDSAAGRGEAFVQLGIQNWSQPVDHGLIGRCIRLREPVMSGDVYAEQGYEATPETVAVRSELVVPLLVDGEVWGVINCEELRADAFDADDVRLLQTAAAQAGAALRTARLYGRLERAYLGTAEALAAALEAKDAYTADHARSIADLAEAVGRRLGMGDADLHDLRLAAVFHDIGKIAVPDWILNKPGPLTEDEGAVMERHTIVGEQILAPVEFLGGGRPLVRHEHERWDGRGYPDGLAGEEIPLGARIILACDALHAMTSDRPYRSALPHEVAHDELRRHAGSQFDPRVVEALLAGLAAAVTAA